MTEVLSSHRTGTYLSWVAIEPLARWSWTKICGIVRLRFREMYPMFSRLVFGLVHLASRRGLYDGGAVVPGETAAERRTRIQHGTGVRGETYAYWYLRRHGYVVIAKNYRSPVVKGEIDLVGYDGEVLAFVEVKTRRMNESTDIKPEENVTYGKQHALVRMARQFLREWRLKDVPWRFDLLAIENPPGQPPVVRLHKDAFRQSGPRWDT